MEYCHEDKFDSLLETSHYTCFREQVIGLPILGMLSNIEKINREMIVDFHNNNYYGDNIVITGAGEISHEDLIEAAKIHFGGLGKNPYDGMAAEAVQAA